MPRRFRLAGHGRIVSAGGSAGVALLVIAAPLVAATVTHTAPYKHSSFWNQPYVQYGGTCKKSASVTSTRWLPLTGNFTTNTVATAKGCAPNAVGYANAYAYADTYSTVAFPMKVKTGGHNFSVYISYNLTVTASATGTYTPCPVAVNTPGVSTYSSCDWGVGAYTQWYVELYDATNHSYEYGSYNHGGTDVQGPSNFTGVSNSSYCYSGSCHYYNYSYNCATYKGFYYNCAPSGSMVSGSNISWLNSSNLCSYWYSGGCYTSDDWTLNGSHRYFLLVTFEASASASMQYYGKGHSLFAAVNAATFGNTGWKISRITVT